MTELKLALLLAKFPSPFGVVYFLMKNGEASIIASSIFSFRLLSELYVFL